MKRKDRHSFCISKFTASKNVVRWISKKTRFRGHFNKQHGRRPQALLKSAWQHFCQIHWSLQSQLSCKKSVLLTFKMLVLFCNTLAADEKYPVFNRDNLTIPIQMQLSQKQNTFCQFFLPFLKSSLNFKYFKKKMTLIDFVFSKIRTSKTYSYKFLKRNVSEDPSKSSMVNVPNHFWNLRHSTFIIFIDCCQVNWAGKISLNDMQNLGTAS